MLHPLCLLYHGNGLAGALAACIDDDALIGKPVCRTAEEVPGKLPGKEDKELFQKARLLYSLMLPSWAAFTFGIGHQDGEGEPESNNGKDDNGQNKGPFQDGPDDLKDCKNDLHFITCKITQ